MLEIEVCENREVWDNYVLDNLGHPLQLWGWGEVKRLHGWRVDRLLAYRDEKIVAAASVLTRKLPKPFTAYSYIPRGPVGPEGQGAEFLDAAASFVKEHRKSLAIAVEPDSLEFQAPESWIKSSNSILPALTVQLDLRKSESELLSVMAKKTRQYIRKSAADVTIKKVRTLKELDECLAIYTSTAKRADFDLHDLDYYRDVFRKMEDNSIVYAALSDGKVVAFLWLAISASDAFELYGGMSEQGSELRANYALKWQAIKDCKSWGLEIYDFGGIIGEGIATFKRSWTDHDTELAGTYDKPLSSMYTAWTKALPYAKKVVQKIRRLAKR